MSRLQRFVRDAHGWGGVVFALYLFVISSSGTLLLWKQAYLWLAIPEARVDFEPTPEALAAIASDIEVRFDDRDILQIQFPTEQLALTKVIFPEAHYAYVSSNGTLIDEWVLNERWEEWLYDLHHRLLLGDAGLSLTGSAGFVLLSLVVLGIIAFWPLRRGFGRGLWPRSTARPFLLKAHRNIGILVVLPFLLSLTTGIVLAFPGWAYHVIGIQQEADWHPLGTSQIYVDAPEGYMDVRIDGAALPIAERAFNAAYPLHTGRLNLGYRLVLTASGLGLVLAGIFGLLGFLRRFQTRS